jgi:hypothetical protein
MKQILPALLSFVLLAGCTDNSLTPAQPKLKSVTSYIQDQKGEFRPGEKTVYTYSSGQLESSEQLQYDTQTKEFYHFSTDTYVYLNNKLTSNTKAIQDIPLKKTTRYEYENGKVSKITSEDNLTTTAVIRYLKSDSIEVFYQVSNGRSFTYKFAVANGSITYEKTIGDDLQLASESNHEYDSSNNPYQLLGYTDMFFLNFSAHNKIKSSSQYYSLAFPQLIPVAYDYEYNS